MCNFCLKESEAGEAALQLQFAEKRVASLETHVGSLNGSIKRLEEELDASAKVTRSLMFPLDTIIQLTFHRSCSLSHSTDEGTPKFFYYEIE